MGGSNSRVGLFRDSHTAVFSSQIGVAGGKESVRVQSRRYDIDRKLQVESSVQLPSTVHVDCNVAEFRGSTAVSILRSLNASEIRHLRASHTRCPRAPNGPSSRPRATSHTVSLAQQTGPFDPHALSHATLFDLIEPVCKARCLRLLTAEHVLPPLPSAGGAAGGRDGVYAALLGATHEGGNSAQEHAPGGHTKDGHDSHTLSCPPHPFSAPRPFSGRVPGGSTGSSPASSVTGVTAPLPTPPHTGQGGAGVAGGSAVGGARSHLGGSEVHTRACTTDPAAAVGVGGAAQAGSRMGTGVPGGDHDSSGMDHSGDMTEDKQGTGPLPLSLFLAGGALAVCQPCSEGGGCSAGEQGEEQGQGHALAPSLDPCPALTLQNEAIVGACISRPDSWLDLLLWLEGIQAVLADASSSPSPATGTRSNALVGVRDVLGVASRCSELERQAGTVFPYINLFHLYASDVDQDDEDGSSGTTPGPDAGPSGYSLRPHAALAMATGAAGHGSSSEAVWATRMGWRLRLVDWLHNVCKHFELSPEVMLSSLSRADYHMHAIGPGLTRTHTQLLYLTALLLEAEGAGARQEVLAGIKGVAPAYTAADFQSMSSGMQGREGAHPCKGTGQEGGWAGGLGQAMKGAQPLKAAWTLLDLLDLPGSVKSKARDAVVEGAVLAARDFSLHRWSPSTLGTALAYLALRATGAWAEEALPQALLCGAANGEYKGETEALSHLSRVCLAWCQLVHACLHVDGSAVEQAAVAILCTAEQGMAPLLSTLKAKAAASTVSLLSNPHPGVSLASQAGISVQAAVTVLYGSSAASAEEDKGGVHGQGQGQGQGVGKGPAQRVPGVSTAPSSSFPAALHAHPLGPTMTYPVPIPAVPLTFASASLCLPGQPDAAGLAGYAMRLASDMSALRLHSVYAVGGRSCSAEAAAPPFTYLEPEDGQGDRAQAAGGMRRTGGKYAQVMRHNVSMGSLLDSSSQRNARAVLRDYFSQRMAQASMVAGTAPALAATAPASTVAASAVSGKVGAGEPSARKRTAAALSQPALPVPVPVSSAAEGGRTASGQGDRDARSAAVQAEGAEGSNGRDSEGGRSIRARLAAGTETSTGDGQAAAAVGLERASSYFRLRHPDAATPAHAQAMPTAPTTPQEDIPMEGQDLTAVHSARTGGAPLPPVHPLPAPVSSPQASALVRGFAGMGLGMGQGQGGAAPLVPSLSLGAAAGKAGKGSQLPPPVPGVVIRSRAGSTPKVQGMPGGDGRARAGTGVTGTSASAVRLTAGTAASGTNSTA